MLNSSPLVAFLATDNAEKAIHFYRDKLGLELIEESAFACVFNANGIILRIQKIDSIQTQGFTVLGWEVQDVSALVQQLSQQGIDMLRFDGMQQDSLGIWNSPDGAKVAWFKDPAGNTLSVTELSSVTELG